MEIKPGTLVRVCSPVDDDELKVASEEGYLWTYVRRARSYHIDGPLHLCRSIATGFVHPWYESEFEVPDEEEETV